MWCGVVRSGLVRLGAAGPGKVRLRSVVRVRHGAARQGEIWLGKARCGLVMSGMVGSGQVWFGKVRIRPVAWLGEAGRGTVRLGEAG